VNVVFEVAGTIYPLRESASTSLAEGLRLKAKGEYGTKGVQGALGVANQIEDVLVGERTEPIPLAGDAAEAVFYYLDVAASDPPAQESALYNAVHTLHRQLHD
jgi:hypothetical protein